MNCTTSHQLAPKRFRFLATLGAFLGIVLALGLFQTTHVAGLAKSPSSVNQTHRLATGLFWVADLTDENEDDSVHELPISSAAVVSVVFRPSFFFLVRRPTAFPAYLARASRLLYLSHCRLLI